MVAQPSVHRIAALLGWLRRPFQTMTNANDIIKKNGTISSAPKMEPIHCQYPGNPIQKKWCPVPKMPVNSAVATMT